MVVVVVYMMMNVAAVLRLLLFEGSTVDGDEVGRRRRSGHRVGRVHLLISFSPRLIDR